MLVYLYVRSLVTRWKCERAGEVVSNLKDELLKDKAPKEHKFRFVRMSDGRSFFIEAPAPARCISGNCICPLFKPGSSCGQRDCDDYEVQHHYARAYNVYEEKLNKYIQAKEALDERLKRLYRVFGK